MNLTLLRRIFDLGHIEEAMQNLLNQTECIKGTTKKEIKGNED